MIEAIINLNEPNGTAQLFEMLRPLKGKHRVQVMRYASRRSDAQNRLLWVAINHPFGEFLRAAGVEVGGHLATDEDAHDILKFKFARQTVVDPLTGEIIGEKCSTASMSIPQFTEYVEQCTAYLHSIGCDVRMPGNWRAELHEANRNEAA